MDLKQETLNYLWSEHHFTEQEFKDMFSVEEFKSLYENESISFNVKKNIDDFLEVNYYGRMRRSRKRYL